MIEINPLVFQLVDSQERCEKYEEAYDRLYKELHPYTIGRLTCISHFVR